MEQLDKPTNPDPRELARRWQSALGRLQLELNTHNYNTWLAGTRACAFDGAEVVVEAKSAMACDWLERRMRVVIERATAQAFGGNVGVRFVAPGEIAEPDHATTTKAAAGPAPQASGRPPLTIGTVNCAFTLEDYLATRGNELALQACRAIIEPSDLVISPVVLWGSPGMGKTHLLHALACRAVEMGRRVACLSAEEFTNRFIGAIKSNRAEDFKDQVRTVDVLIIDDLQAIVGKEKTIDELVWTMEEVRNSGGHVVVASELHPLELKLPDRLESRLLAGIVTRVEPFEFGERRAFVEHVARRHRVALPGWAADRLAQTSAPSVRMLLGFINSAMAMERTGKLEPGALDAALGARVLSEACAELGAKEVLDRVARHFGLGAEDILGRGRDARAAQARSVAAVALQQRGYSLPRIGSLFGGRDKSTMSTIASRGRALVKAREELRELIAG
jgi:chromosomal replication initiator protein